MHLTELSLVLIWIGLEREPDSNKDSRIHQLWGMKVGEFQDKLGVSSKAYSAFMSQNRAELEHWK
jgi:hypothetical protein